jgi:predicted membrane protein
MMCESKKSLFLVFAVILLIVNMMLIRQTFSFSGELFLFELFLVIFLGIMAIDSINELTKNNASCFIVLAIYFGLLMINSAGLKMAANIGMSLSILLLSGIGFLLSAANIGPKKNDKSEETFKDVENDVIKDIVISKEKSEPVKASYPLGYIASKSGKKYHMPKCDFAKKISRKNRIWLNDQAEAKKMKLKPCNCIKA